MPALPPSVKSVMLTTITAFALAAAGGTVLWVRGRREHHEALAGRAALLDDACSLFGDARMAIGPDGFPTLAARLPDGRRTRLLLIADTLVTRRLPQLWLELTVLDAVPRRDFSVGAIARSTGSEFFSMVHALPQSIAPANEEVPLVMRGRSLRPDQARAAAGMLTPSFADPQLKEAVLTPRGVRIIRQASEGDRAAHLLLRQARFPGVRVRNVVERALADAQSLERAFGRPPFVVTASAGE